MMLRHFFRLHITIFIFSQLEKLFRYEVADRSSALPPGFIGYPVSSAGRTGRKNFNTFLNSSRGRNYGRKNEK
jgi:hypothetical protein